MNSDPGRPDPSLYIDRLTDESAFYREAAAWSLGEIGSPRAARPLAGLLLREIQSVERSGYITNGDVVRTVVESMRRIDSTESLYALVKALCVLSHSKGVKPAIVEEILESIAAVGGLHAVREAADKVVRQCTHACAGAHVVADVLLERLALCGDAAVFTLRRLARRGPEVLRLRAATILRRV